MGEEQETVFTSVSYREVALKSLISPLRCKRHLSTFLGFFKNNFIR